MKALNTLDENYAMQKTFNNALNLIFVTRFDYFHLAVMLN